MVFQRSALLCALVLVTGCPAKDPCKIMTCDDLGDPLDLAQEDALAGSDQRLDPDLRGDLGVPPDGGDLGKTDGGGLACNPGVPGSRTVATFDLAIPISAMIGAEVQTTVVGPSEDGTSLSMMGAPYPTVVISPGFTLPRSQFVEYGKRLASHGIVAVLQKARMETDHAQYRDDTKKVFDWLINPSGPGASKIMGRVDKDALGVAGHSLGGKISILTAAADPRIKAVFGIDPVDGGVMGSPSAQAEIAKIRLPMGIPIGLLGETVSKMGAMACAPAAQNYEVLYMKAPAPAFAVTFVGAAHMDFVDNPAMCLQCALCPGGTAPKMRTHDLAVKYTAAYFLWALSGKTSCADHLQGMEFNKDVMAGYVTKDSK